VTKKEIAQDFLTLASRGQVKKAFELYVADNFKHHNVWFKGDRHTLMTAMEENAKLNPDKIFEIQRSLEDGNLVSVHSRVRQTLNDLGAAVIHIFLFAEEKIVELWDFGQAVPAEMVNENGMF
jgi:predicted SnoaL-like aldol condensation-catalyzing enzyme